MAHSLDTSKLKVLFDGFRKEKARLSEWELEFVASVFAQWKSKKELTDAQLSKLEQLWVKLP